MVPMLSELWRLARYLLRPEKAEDPGFRGADRTPPWPGWPKPCSGPDCPYWPGLVLPS